MSDPSARTWPGLWLHASEAICDALEPMAAGVIDEGDLLGLARETRPGTASESLAVYLALEADPAICRDSLAHLCERLYPSEWRAGEIRIEPFMLPEEDWATQWRDFFRPLRASDRVVILPAWWDEADGLHRLGIALGERPAILRIEPGRAFGSGSHATTQLALRHLEARMHAGASVLDFGSGSGILALAAVLLGAGRTVGVEVDAECLENFELNSRINGLAGRVEYRIGSTEVIEPLERFDLVVCNVLFQLVRPCLPALSGALERGGWLVLSGFLETQRGEVHEAIEAAGLEIAAMDRREEWGALVAHVASK